MDSNRYDEFDPQRPIQNKNIEFPDLSQQQNYNPANNFPNPPMQPIQTQMGQSQMPVPLSYGVPIDMRHNSFFKEISKNLNFFFNLVRTAPISRYSENLFCFNCQRIVPTQVTFTPGAGTWTSVLIVAMVGCLLGCCLIPFCIEDCQDAKHSCSSCGCELGKKRFLFN